MPEAYEKEAGIVITFKENTTDEMVLAYFKGLGLPSPDHVIDRSFIAKVPIGEELAWIDKFIGSGIAKTASFVPWPSITSDSVKVLR